MKTLSAKHRESGGLHLLVMNLYYPPDTAATAQQIELLCEGLARKHSVRVICGHPSYDPAYRLSLRLLRREVLNSVRIYRVFSTTFHRSWMAGRVANYLTYLVSAFIVGMFLRRPDVVIANTDPPFNGLIAWTISRIKRAPLVYAVRDLHPDVIVKMGMMRNRAAIQLMKRIERFVLRKAEAVVVLSDSTRHQILKKSVKPERVSVVPDCADTVTMRPQAKDNEFSRRHELADMFVVMYSGNLGLSHDLETLVQVARMLKGYENIRFVFIGEGAAKPSLSRLVERESLSNVLFLPYQPREKMRYSFASADVFIVSLASGLDGMVVPSKVFAIMASGRPFIAAIDSSSEAARIAERFGCGLVVESGNPDALAVAVLELYRDPKRRSQMGKRARGAVKQHFSRESNLKKYEEVLGTVRNGSRVSTGIAPGKAAVPQTQAETEAK